MQQHVCTFCEQLAARAQATKTTTKQEPRRGEWTRELQTRLTLQLRLRDSRGHEVARHVLELLDGAPPGVAVHSIRLLCEALLAVHTNGVASEQASAATELVMLDATATDDRAPFGLRVAHAVAVARSIRQDRDWFTKMQWFMGKRAQSYARL